jgi:tocopherol O-methyltransferase
VLDKLIEYYEGTRFDYWVAWLDRDNPAIHFGYYDEKARYHKEALLRLNEVMAEWAGIGAGSAVLDAGCGLGASCLWMAGKLGAAPVGITPVPGQVLGARKNAQRQGLEGQTRFELADYHAAPFADASFDVVWACESLCHSPSKESFYREAYRLLRPGGKLIVAEYMRSGRPLSDRQEALLADWLRGWAIPDIDSCEEHQAHASSAGFASMDIRDVTNHTRISHRNLYKQARRWRKVGRILGALGVRSAVQLGNHEGAVKQYEALSENAWHYGLGLAEKL